MSRIMLEQQQPVILQGLLQKRGVLLNPLQWAFLAAATERQQKAEQQ